MKKTVIFDLDGTLVDSMTGLSLMAAHLISENYHLTLEAARTVYLKTSGLPFLYQLEQIFPSHRLNSKIASRFESQKSKNYRESPFFHDVACAIKEISLEGYLIAISSNNNHELVEEMIANLPVRPNLVLGHRAGFFKGRDHFLKIRQHFHLNPDQPMVFVGDSLHDARLAQENGVVFLARAGTFSKEDFKTQGIAIAVVSDFSNLIIELETLFNSKINFIANLEFLQ